MVWAVKQKMQFCVYKCANDSVNHFSTLWERAPELYAVSLIFLCLLLCFLTKEDSHAFSLFLPVPWPLRKERHRSRNSISFVLQGSMWTCDCATHGIMVPEQVPFFHSFYFTSWAVGECITSSNIFFFFLYSNTHTQLHQILHFFYPAEIAILSQWDRGKPYLCVKLWLSALVHVYVHIQCTQFQKQRKMD